VGQFADAADPPAVTIEDSADQDEPFEPPADRPSIEGACNRCGYRGKVYAGRYGGYRCTVCFGLQHGWMPRGERAS
jgi:hypothetical protein